jgi:transcriptional regulator with XRE-family HTH domain
MSVQIGKKIMDLRLAKGWSQDELGQYIHHSQSHISDLEKGKDPRWSELVLIADALGVGVATLLPKAQEQTVFNVSAHDHSTQSYIGNITINLPLDEFLQRLKDPNFIALFTKN